MAWELKIIHIDLVGSGDATLLIARNRNVAGAVIQTRSMLIDGGHLFNWRDLDQIIHTNEGLASLDVIVTTHYDADHYNGIRGLMTRNEPRYQNCRIYDQGIPVGVTPRPKKRRGPGGVVITSVNYAQGFEADYDRYVAAIARQANRTRVTELVCSVNHPDAELERDGYEEPSFLIDREVLWDGVGGGVPANAPTATVVAVNSYVSQIGGGSTYLSSGLLNTETLKNERSIALLIEFGNFKYYVGGDLENAQENNANYGLKRILNPTNNAAGRVHAFKTSHHGSQHSTETGFLNRIRGRAAIISCARNNQYGHPDNATIGRLNANATVQRYYLTGDQYGRGFINAKARVCGSSTRYGDVTLDITEAQSTNNPPNFDIEYGRPNAGNNPYDGTVFAENPYANYVSNF